MAKNKYYAVKVGKVPGIFDSWEECKSSVDGHPGATYKGFSTIEDAEAYLSEDDSPKHNELVIPDCPYAFVDGSYNPETDEYGYGGFVCLDADANGYRERYVFCGKGYNGDVGEMRNVAGEIKAAMVAVKYAADNGVPELCIFHDYVGIEAWVTGRWKANNDYTRAYSRYMQIMQTRIKINFVHVQGHTGVEGNELADKLAKKGCGV